MPEQLELTLTAPKSVVRGEFFFLSLTLRNRGDVASTVSARLNLFESDLFIQADLPDGRHVRLQGHTQIDSLPNLVELGPGEQIESSCSVFFTDCGFAFDTAGAYKLRAEYYPHLGKPPIFSNYAEVTILPESDESQRERSAQTMTEEFGQGVACGEADGVEDKFEALVTQFPDSQAATVAGMVLAVSKARSAESPDAQKAIGTHLQHAAERDSPHQVARLAMTIAPPAPSPDDPLLGALDVFLEAASQEHEDMQAIQESLRKTRPN